MNLFSYDMATLFQANGIGTLGTDLFGLEFDQNTDKQVLIREGSGSEATAPQSYEEGAVQILARGNKSDSFTVVHAMLEPYYSFIKTLATFEVNDTCYTGAWANQSISTLGRDQEDRPLAVFNVRIDRQGYVGVNNVLLTVQAVGTIPDQLSLDTDNFTLDASAYFEEVY